ncbi:hypothetical protein LEP1GSC179_3967 [Leptospira santarosai str. MOR084]|uniref:Uncharacterized protein n=1 Tax=Leptospira santarosai str. MOR084 TaxID=1049984 RepID=A0A0E2BA01_9LEPT|nr:hypothetical protein LEP1GSC179_3967 [Leptospira santarosai str. MOR084]
MEWFGLCYKSFQVTDLTIVEFEVRWRKYSKLKFTLKNRINRHAISTDFR